MGNFLNNSRNGQRHRPLHELGKNENKTCPFHELGNEKSPHYTNGAIDFLIHRDMPIFYVLRPLTSKQAIDVARTLLSIFVDFGALLILQEHITICLS